MTYDDDLPQRLGIVRFIDTPNTNNGVMAFEVTLDFDSATINDLNDDFNNNLKYTGIEFLSDASALYNCHSYAWYRQNTNTNNYWIDDPSRFYTDGSYCESDYPQDGDIICYFDKYGNNLHSGIVTNVIYGPSQQKCGYSDLAVVTSKWGPSALYSHNGYVCPYTSHDGGSAITVKFYRKEHSYSTYSSNGAAGHSSTCTECGYTTAFSHTYTYSYGTSLTSHTADCSKCSYSCSEAHDWQAFGTKFHCLKCGMTTIAIPVLPSQLPPSLLASIQQNMEMNVYTAAVDENTVLCYIDGQYYLVKGYTENEAVQAVMEQIHEAA